MKNHTLLVSLVVSGMALAAVGCGTSEGPPAGGTGGAGAGGASALCATKPPATAVISDFTTGTTAGVNPQQGRTGGWYVYFMGDGNDGNPPNPGTLNPPKSANGIARDNTMGGPCSGPGTLRQQATGITGYGVGIGTNIASAVGGKHGTFDASAYAGVRLFMKCAKATEHILVKLPTADTDFDAATPMCKSYSDCNAHGIFGQMVGTDWTKLELPFATITQDPGQTGTTAIPTFDKSKITAIQLQVNANYDAAMVASPNDFDCYIDDVYFY